MKKKIISIILLTTALILVGGGGGYCIYRFLKHEKSQNNTLYNAVIEFANLHSEIDSMKESIVSIDKVVSEIETESAENHFHVVKQEFDEFGNCKQTCTICGLTKTYKYEMENLIFDFASFTNKDGSIHFSWQSTATVEVRVYLNGVLIKNEDASNSFVFYGIEGHVYKFLFVPHKEDGQFGKTITCTRMILSSDFQSGLPRIDINTGGFIWPSCQYVSPPEDCWGLGITDNEYVNNTEVTVTNSDGSIVFSSKEEKNKIKIRGNTSAYKQKKSYKLKLKNKEDLIELINGKECGDNKEWLLLGKGESINEVVGFSVAQIVGLDWVPDYCYVDLFINGDYQGVYIFCEAVTDGDGRIQIDKNEGYIIENDAYWWNEGDYYFRTGLEHMGYTFKYPDTDDFSVDSDTFLYIKEYMLQLEDCFLHNPKKISDYIDVNSFAKWLLASDILGFSDYAGTNMFLIKENRSSPLKMELIWDCDTVMGQQVQKFSGIHDSSIFYYQYLNSNDEFILEYKNLFLKTSNAILNELSKTIDNLPAESIDYSRYFDSIRWSLNHQTIDEQKEQILSWMEEHIDWISSQL